MTQPLRVDTAALRGAAQELARLSDELDHSLTHEWQPPADQPSAKATVAVTAATNHVKPLHVAADRQLDVLMRRTRYVVALIAALTACSSAPEMPAPPDGFPDLNAFNSVDRDDFNLGGTAFVSPDQVHCLLDHGSHKSVVCGGAIDGVPASITGNGCPRVYKPEDGPSDAPYVFSRSEGACTTARWKPITTGKKLTGDNSTCVVGKGNLVACIDADHRHGFVLQPSGSWTF